MDESVSLVEVYVSEFSLDGSVPESCLLSEDLLHFIRVIGGQMIAAGRLNALLLFLLLL